MAKPVKLNLIVDKSCNRVIFAESDEHFVDILLSFLTLPLGSIIRLTKQSMGSMNKLLESVETLNSVCFNTEACRSMLLCPLNSVSNLISSLAMNYDNINNLFPFYYTCSSSSCSYPRVSFYANAHCSCGGQMNKKLVFVPANAPSSIAYSSVFCNSAFKFSISDDVHVSQSSVEFSIGQLSKLDIKQRNSLESVSVDVTAGNILELLKQLLVSNTPFTDVFLGVHNQKADKVVQVIQQPLLAPSASTGKISMKLYVNKEEDTVLIAEADNDFVDLMFGFLTYPMGAVISKLGGQSGIRCMDNLYNSIEALKTAKCFRNNELIGKLLNPKLPSYFKAKNQLINLDEETQIQSYFICSFAHCQNSSKVGNNPFTCVHYFNVGTAKQQCSRQLNLTDPKCGSNVEHRGGYMKFSRYMITDDLFIRQPSSFIVITDILREAAGKGIHARNVEIGEQEVCRICLNLYSCIDPCPDS
ncbi:hypothetical protein KSP40_PGU009799 [Platanthera guangdongensis]|uniref:DUF674 family protein n=1 Tax=Platanthera guangdongensis TaxID=2320717 RepID=A0ABR2MR43_9ASPA